MKYRQKLRVLRIHLRQKLPRSFCLDLNLDFDSSLQPSLVTVLIARLRQLPLRLLSAALLGSMFESMNRSLWD